jgi:hypothetical protein
MYVCVYVCVCAHVCMCILVLLWKELNYSPILALSCLELHNYIIRVIMPAIKKDLVIWEQLFRMNCSLMPLHMDWFDGKARSL